MLTNTSRMSKFAPYQRGISNRHAHRVWAECKTIHELRGCARPQPISSTATFVLYSLMYASFVYLILDAAQRIPDISPYGKAVVWFVLSALMASTSGVAIVLASFKRTD